MEKPAVVGGGEVERADGMDAHFGVEVGVVGQAVEGFGAEEPVGHALDDEVVVVAPAEAYVPLVGKEAVVPPAFGGKQDVHGLEDGALSAVAALDEFGDIAVAEAEAEDDVACVPTHLEGSGELLQVEGREMAPEVAVFECESLLAGGGEQGGLSGEAGGDAVAAGVFGPDAECEGGSDLPVEHQGAAAEGACSVVGVVEAVAGEGEGTAFGGLLLAVGRRDCNEKQQEREEDVFHWIKGIDDRKGYWRVCSNWSARVCICRARRVLSSRRFQMPSSLSTPRLRSGGRKPRSSSARSCRHSSLLR